MMFINVKGDFEMKLIFFLIFMFTFQVDAESRYKCETRDSISYQYKPCESDVKQTILEDQSTPSEESQGIEYDNLIISDFHVKPTKLDTIGNQWFSIKVRITNKSTTVRTISLTYQALDKEGFEIAHETLRGTLLVGQSETLTDTSYLSSKEFGNIKEWKLKK